MKDRNTSDHRRALGRGAAALIGGLALVLALSSFSAAAQGGKPPVSTSPASGNQGNAPALTATPSPTTTPGLPPQYFQDIAPGSFWYAYTSLLYTQGIVSGYPCSQPPAGACVPPNNLPYYLSTNTVSRGEMSRYIAQARSQPGINISETNRLPGITVAEHNNYFAITGTNSYTAGTALYGEAAGIGLGDGLSNLSEGVYGYASGITESVGLGAYSQNYVAAWIDNGFPGSYYGAIVQSGGMLIGDVPNARLNSVIINGDLTVAGAKTGYVTDIMRNTGPTDLQSGDIVVAGSLAAEAAQVGSIPVASASASAKPYDSGVLGVVDRRWVPGDPQAALGAKAHYGYYDDAAVIHPGEYMGVVTLGAYKGVKVDASSGPIHVGDLLTTSGTTGAAMKASDRSAAFGAVVGKALGNLDRGSGTIAVMVTLR